jgi:hypothetical protein
VTIKAIFFLITVAVFLTNCSVYKSQGRKDFETDTPARVPISLTFQCQLLNSPNRPVYDTSLEELRTIPDLVLRHTMYQETVVLLASSSKTEQLCTSEGLDLAYYLENQDVFASQ